MLNKSSFAPIPYHAQFFKALVTPYRMVVLTLLEDFEDYNEYGKLDLEDVSRRGGAISLGVYHAKDDIKSCLQAIEMQQYFGVKNVKWHLLAEQETIDVMLPQGKATLAHRKDKYNGLDGSDLVDLCWLSLFCEEVEDIHYLATLAEHPNTKWYSERSRIFFDIQLALFGVKATNVHERIQQFVEYSTPEHLSELAFKHANLIDLVNIDLMIKVFTGVSEEEYQQAMHQAVQSHHEYWSGKDVKEERDGFFSMPLLALAKFAYQKYGYRLGFETDYVPEPFYTQKMPEFSYLFLDKYKS